MDLIPDTDLTDTNAWFRVKIPAGSSYGRFRIRMLDDNKDESSETLKLAIGTVRNATRATSNNYYALKIIDNDTAPIVSGPIGMPEPAIGRLAIYLGMDGALAGSTAFFDANKNGVLDFLDLDGDGLQGEGEPTEYSTTTAADGLFAIEFSEVFDLNGNGLIDLDEGQVVVTGGVDAATGLPMAGTLVAPMGMYAVSSLTTLIAGLVNEHALSVEDAQDRVLQALSLPDINLAAFHIISETVNGQRDVLSVITALAQLEIAVAQTAELAANLPGAPPRALLVDLAYAGLVAKIVDPQSSFDLTEPVLLEGMVQGVLWQTGLELDTAVVSGAASVMAAANQRIEAIPVTPDVSFLTQIAQTQVVAQGAAATQLGAVAAGTANVEEVVQSYTGAGAGSTGRRGLHRQRVRPQSLNLRYSGYRTRW